MTTRHTELMSALAANRKRFFELVEVIERESVCELDIRTLEALLDAHYPGRDQLTTEEARLLLIAVSHPVVEIDHKP